MGAGRRAGRCPDNGGDSTGPKAHARCTFRVRERALTYGCVLPTHRGVHTARARARTHTHTHTHTHSCTRLSEGQPCPLSYLPTAALGRLNTRPLSLGGGGICKAVTSACQERDTGTSFSRGGRLRPISRPSGAGLGGTALCPQPEAQRTRRPHCPLMPRSELSIFLHSARRS